MDEFGMRCIENQGKCALLEHEWSDVACNQKCLCVEVLEYFIGMPATNEVDAIGINIGTEHHHGTAGLE